jgi:hypothetical protein
MSARGALVNHLDPLLSGMVSLSSLLLGGGWQMDWCVALNQGAINSPRGTYVKGGPTGLWNGLGRPAWAHFGLVRGLPRPVSVPESSRSFPLLHVGPCRLFLSELDEAPCLARFDTFWLGPRSLSSSRVRSLCFMESSLLHCMTCTRLQGLVTRCLMNLS